jgi:hypothetical protein
MQFETRTNGVTVYPQGQLSRAKHFITIFDTTLLPYDKQFNNCNNTLCYTQSKGTFIHKPHSNRGQVGTSSAGHLARRKRI